MRSITVLDPSSQTRWDIPSSASATIPLAPVPASHDPATYTSHAPMIPLVVDVVCGKGNSLAFLQTSRRHPRSYGRKSPEENWVAYTVQSSMEQSTPSSKHRNIFCPWSVTTLDEDGETHSFDISIVPDPEDVSVWERHGAPSNTPAMCVLSPAQDGQWIATLQHPLTSADKHPPMLHSARWLVTALRHALSVASHGRT